MKGHQLLDVNSGLLLHTPPPPPISALLALLGVLILANPNLYSVSVTLPACLSGDGKAKWV